jgi:hypothetical protein
MIIGAVSSVRSEGRDSIWSATSAWSGCAAHVSVHQERRNGYFELSSAPLERQALRPDSAPTGAAASARSSISHLQRQTARTPPCLIGLAAAQEKPPCVHGLGHIVRIPNSAAVQSPLYGADAVILMGSIDLSRARCRSRHGHRVLLPPRPQWNNLASGRPRGFSRAATRPELRRIETTSFPHLWRRLACGLSARLPFVLGARRSASRTSGGASRLAAAGCDDGMDRWRCGALSRFSPSATSTRPPYFCAAAARVSRPSQA